MGYTEGDEKTAILGFEPSDGALERSPSKTKRVVACVAVALTALTALVAFQATMNGHAVMTVEPVQPLTLASAQVSQDGWPIETANPILQSGQEMMIICAQDDMCLDDNNVFKFRRGSTGKALHLATCSFDNKNQRFVYDATTKMVKNPNKDLCWDDGGRESDGVYLGSCEVNDNTKFVYDWTTRAFKIPTKPGKCVDASDNFKYRDCDPSRPTQQFDILSKGYW